MFFTKLKVLTMGHSRKGIVPFACTDFDFNSVWNSREFFCAYRPYNGIQIEQTLNEYWLDFIIDKQDKTVWSYLVFYWLNGICSNKLGKIWQEKQTTNRLKSLSITTLA